MAGNSDKRIRLCFSNDSAALADGPFLNVQCFKKYSVLPRLLEAKADKAISRPEYKSGAEDIWLPNPDEFRRPFRRSGVRKSTVSEGSINPSGEHSQEQARQDSCNDCPSIDPGNLQGSNLNLGRSTSYAASHNGYEQAQAPGTPALDKVTDLKVVVPVQEGNLGPSSCQASAADRTGSNKPSPQTGRSSPHNKNVAEAPAPNRNAKQKGGMPTSKKAPQQKQRAPAKAKAKDKTGTQAGNVALDTAGKTAERAEEKSAPRVWSKTAAKGAFTAQVTGVTNSELPEGTIDPKTQPPAKADGPAFLHAPPKPKNQAQLGVAASTAKVSSPGRLPPGKSLRGRSRKGPGKESASASRPTSAKTAKKGKIGKIRTNLAKKAARGGAKMGSRDGSRPDDPAAEPSKTQDEDVQPEDQAQPEPNLYDAADELDDLLMAGLDDDSAGSDEDLSVKGQDPTPRLPSVQQQPQCEAIRPADSQVQALPTKQTDLQQPVTHAAAQPQETAGKARVSPVWQSIQISPQSPMKNTSKQLPSRASGRQGRQNNGPARREDHKVEGGLSKGKVPVPAQGLKRDPKVPQTQPAIAAGDNPAGQADVEKADGRKESRKRRRPNQEYHQHDVLNTNVPFYDPQLDREIRDLQKFASTLEEDNQLLSALTKQQHAFYITNAGKSLAGKQLANLQELQATIAREQALYMRVAHIIGAASHAESLAYCSPNAMAYFQESSREKRRKVKEHPQYYQLCSNLDLSAVRFKSDVQFQALHAEDSWSPMHSFTSPSPGQHLDMHDTSLGPDAEDDSIEGACPNKISEECSEKIGLGQAGTAMEIGFGALQAIMGLLDPDFGPEWELCIQVHPQSPGKSRHHVGISEPLSRRSWGLRELHSDMFQRHLFRMGCQVSANEVASTGEYSSRLCSLLVDHWKVNVQCPSMICCARDGSNTEPSTQPNESPEHQPGEELQTASKVMKSKLQSERGNEAAKGEKRIALEAKVHYHSDSSRGEVVTDLELGRWWLDTQLLHADSLWVGRVDLQSCRLVKSERMSAQEINNQASSKQIPQRFAAWLFYLIERLQKLAPGAYLMTHANKAVHATIWQASSLNVKGTAKAVPLDGSRGVDAGALYDLWLAHSPEKPLHTIPAEYVPLVWEPVDQKIPQIPYTFKPRTNIPQRTRKRKLQPSFVTQRHGADWDEITDPLAQGGTVATQTPDVDMYDDL